MSEGDQFPLFAALAGTDGIELTDAGYTGAVWQSTVTFRGMSATLLCIVGCAPTAANRGMDVSWNQIVFMGYGDHLKGMDERGLAAYVRSWLLAKSAMGSPLMVHVTGSAENNDLREIQTVRRDWGLLTRPDHMAGRHKAQRRTSGLLTGSSTDRSLRLIIGELAFPIAGYSAAERTSAVLGVLDAFSPLADE